MLVAAAPAGSAAGKHILGLRAGRAGLGAQPAARVSHLATTTVIAAGKDTCELVQSASLAGVNSTDCVELIMVTSKGSFCFFFAFLSSLLAQAEAELGASRREPGKGSWTGGKQCSCASVTSTPFVPEGELKLRQKSSRLKAEPLFCTGCYFKQCFKG